MLFSAHPPSNNSLVKCMLSLFIIERDSKFICREDRRPLIGNRWDRASGSMLMNCRECDHDISLFEYAELGS